MIPGTDMRLVKWVPWAWRSSRHKRRKRRVFACRIHERKWAKRVLSQAGISKRWILRAPSPGSCFPHSSVEADSHEAGRYGPLPRCAGCQCSVYRYGPPIPVQSTNPMRPGLAWRSTNRPVMCAAWEATAHFRGASARAVPRRVSRCRRSAGPAGGRECAGRGLRAWFRAGVVPARWWRERYSPRNRNCDWHGRWWGR